jgi:acetyl esterase/lipase
MERIAYGNGPQQFAELRLPTGTGPFPVAIVIHGGFWRAKYELDYIRPVCEAFAQAKIATWNIEYRRIGNDGGGWRGTLDDVAAAADHLYVIGSSFGLDLNRVVAIGHSAGGHLAMWLATQTKRLAGAISLAGVVDLRRAWELKLSNSVAAEFLGGSPEEVPDRYDYASPIEHLPLGISQRLFHGTEDSSVPLEISERYVRAAQSRGDDAQLVLLPGAGHFELVDPQTKEFALILAAVKKLFASLQDRT